MQCCSAVVMYNIIHAGVFYKTFSFIIIIRCISNTVYVYIKSACIMNMEILFNWTVPIMWRQRQRRCDDGKGMKKILLVISAVRDVRRVKSHSCLRNFPFNNLCVGGFYSIHVHLERKTHTHTHTTYVCEPVFSKHITYTRTYAHV